MDDSQYLNNDDGTISIVETQQVPVETFTPTDLDNEIDSIQSEIKNFALVSKNWTISRMAYLKDRLTTLQQAKTNLNQ